MSTASFTHFIFVDFENVSNVDLSGINGLPIHVTLLIGKNQAKIDLALVEQIKEFTAQVRIVKAGVSGRNALDLILACYLGRSIERAPEAQFAIISKDRDFAPMIVHLHSHGVKIFRHDIFADLPFLPSPKHSLSPKSTLAPKRPRAPKKDAEDRSARLIARLRNPASRNRPSTESALVAHIRTALGKESSEQTSEAVLRKLHDEGVLTIGPNGKIIYTAE